MCGLVFFRLPSAPRAASLLLAEGGRVGSLLFPPQKREQATKGPESLEPAYSDNGKSLGFVVK